MKTIKTTNYIKLSQLSNLPGNFTFPSDKDEAYFSGDDDYADIEYEKDRQLNRDYVGIQDSTKRNERWSKIYPHIDKLNELGEQLKNPNISEIEAKDIRKKMSYSTSAISKILNTPGEISMSPLGVGQQNYEHSLAHDYKLEE